MSGKRPISPAILIASSTLLAVPEGGVLSPMRVMACLNSSRSSARSIDGNFAPMSSTPCFSKMPLSAKAFAKLSPVCPPIVGRIASGFSASRICSTRSGVMGPT